MALEYTGTGNPVEYQAWDSLGRKLSQTNAAGETTRYTYDLTGNLLATTLPMGQVTYTRYDAYGRKTGQLDAKNMLATWTYDARGLVTQSTDIGGAITTYLYDSARQQVEVRNTRGKALTYRYDAAGQLTGAYDAALDQTTRYAYDAAGNRVLERTIQAGKVYQDNHLAYDALGRLRDAADARVHVTFDYDANGNRTRITTHTADPALEVASDRYFQYDSMDRQIVVDAIDAQGNLGNTGHRLTYDLNGNRTTDLSTGNHVTANGGQTVITGYDDRGKARYVTTPITYTKTTGPSLEVYAYDGLNRLTSLVKDGIQLDHRYYDAANRLVQTGPEGNLPVGFAQKLNEGLPPEQINGLESRLARFDANGKITRQLILRSDNSLDTDQRFTYDTVGNLTNETRFHYTPAMQQDTTDSYTHNPIARETYKDAAITRLHIQPPAANGQTDLKQTYDANGYLVGLDDTANDHYDRSLVNDVNGQLLFINQAGQVSRQFIINGEVLGVYGVRPNAVAPTNAQGNPNFAALAEFSFGYQPIASRSLAPSPGNYTTQAGDTLKSIAQRAYGDARLWFRIAEVNSLASDQDLRIGQTLTIPNLPAGTHNDQNTTNAPGTFNTIGDLSPSLPMPQGQGGGGCGGVGNIITTAIAVAVTLALTGPIGLPTATAAAAGSAAGQLAGNALGTQHGFNWKQVALAAIGARVSTLVNANVAVNAVGQAALTSTITQGIGVVTGLQDSFNWQGVIASAAAAGAGVSTVLQGPLVNALPGTEFIPRLLRGTLSATAAGATTALLQGGKLNTVQIATDAFGNALGRSWLQASQPTAPSTTIEAQYVASAYQANAVEPYNDSQASQDFAREQLRFTAAQTTSVANRLSSDDQFPSTVSNAGQRNKMAALASASAQASASLTRTEPLRIEIAGILPENRRDDPDTFIPLSKRVDQSRQDMLASYQDYQDEAVRSGSATSYVTAQLGRFAANVGCDIAQGVTGLYDLATDRQTQQTAAQKLIGVATHPVKTFKSMLNDAQRFADAPFDQQADGVGRFAAGTLLTAGIGNAGVIGSLGELTVNGGKSLGRELGELAQRQMVDREMVLRAVDGKDVFTSGVISIDSLPNTAVRSEAASHIWQARRILTETFPRKTIIERNEIIKAFKLESFRVRTLSTSVDEFRYFDGLPGGANLNGRWSTSQWFDTPIERITNLALPNNQATRAATVNLQPGTTIFQGTVAPQFKFSSSLQGAAFKAITLLALGLLLRKFHD